MKILYICNEYPPFVHGGIGSFTRDISESLSKNGHEIIVWGIYSEIDSVVRETINGVTIIREPGRKDGGRFNALLYRIELQRKLKAFLKQQQVDIIECQEWLGILPFGLKKQNLVVRLHGASIFFDYLLERKGSRLTHWFEKKMIQSSKHIISVSEYCGKVTMSLCGLSKKEFTVIFNAVDSKKISSFHKDKFTSQKLVFANTVSRKKGVFELVDAFCLLVQNNPTLSLYIIGKTQYSENGVNIKDLLLARVPDQYKHQIHILGWLNSANEVYEHLADAHICIYPSHMEGFGIAPVEPMVLGKPVLFMKTGPGPEVIEDQISGLLIDSFSPVDIAEKIEWIFANPQEAKMMGENAAKRAKELFDRDSVFVQQNIRIYESILQNV